MIYLYMTNGEESRITPASLADISTIKESELDEVVAQGWNPSFLYRECFSEEAYRIEA